MWSLTDDTLRTKIKWLLFALFTVFYIQYVTAPHSAPHPLASIAHTRMLRHIIYIYRI